MCAHWWGSLTPQTERPTRRKVKIECAHDVNRRVGSLQCLVRPTGVSLVKNARLWIVAVTNEIWANKYADEEPAGAFVGLFRGRIATAPHNFSDRRIEYVSNGFANDLFAAVLQSAVNRPGVPVMPRAE